MEYRQLGSSGLRISKYILGSLTFSGANGFDKLGTVDVPAAKRMFDMAFDSGVNVIDTANLYAMGGAEEVIGEALKRKRDQALIFSKVRSVMGDGPNEGGASRHHIISECENSLRRLQTDHIDLYQLHNWDGETPIEETLAALEHLVQSGKVRYVGTSNFAGWQMTKTLYTADLMNLTRPVSQQIYYTPESREAEYEMIPMGIDQGLGTLIWSPLGEGLLSGKVRRGEEIPSSMRQGTDWPEPYVRDWDRAYDIIDLLVKVGEQHGVSAAQVVLSWLSERSGVTSVIVGARDEAQLSDNLASLELKLSEDETQRIEELTRPEALYPFWHRTLQAMDRPDPAEAALLDQCQKTMKHKGQAG